MHSGWDQTGCRRQCYQLYIAGDAIVQQYHTSFWKAVSLRPCWRLAQAAWAATTKLLLRPSGDAWGRSRAASVKLVWTCTQFQNHNKGACYIKQRVQQHASNSVAQTAACTCRQKQRRKIRVGVSKRAPTDPHLLHGTRPCYQTHISLQLRTWCHSSSCSWGSCFMSTCADHINSCLT